MDRQFIVADADVRSRLIECEREMLENHQTVHSTWVTSGNAGVWITMVQGSPIKPTALAEFKVDSEGFIEWLKDPEGIGTDFPNLREHFSEILSEGMQVMSQIHDGEAYQNRYFITYMSFSYVLTSAKHMQEKLREKAFEVLAQSFKTQPIDQE